MQVIQSNLGSDGPLHARIATAVRESIRSGRLTEGTLLPPTRDLAADLGCSRWAVTQAYDQLVAEGYLEARGGSGTRVRHGAAATGAATPGAVRAAVPRLDLSPGLPDLRAFPRAAWARASRAALGAASLQDLGYPPAGGHPRLRAAVAGYLTRVRGAVVDPEQVTITTGIRDGVAAVAGALVAAGHRRLAVEDPGWARLRARIAGTGMVPVPVGVDASGMLTDALAGQPVRAALVTPAHQFPTGAVLAPQRRATAVDWAVAVDGLLIEDDYDAEFRYDRRPVGTLQGLAPDRVVLAGSVSKTLAPALRLGWVVTPPAWTEPVRALAGEAALLDQLALADFLDSGGYARHLRLLRRGYRDRRDALVAELERRLPGCAVSGIAAGLHLTVDLPAGVAPARVVAIAAQQGLAVMDLDSCRTAPDPTRPGLVLGYGNLPDRAVPEAVAILAAAVRTAAAG